MIKTNMYFLGEAVEGVFEMSAVFWGVAPYFGRVHVRRFGQGWSGRLASWVHLNSTGEEKNGVQGRGEVQERSLHNGGAYPEIAQGWPEPDVRRRRDDSHL